MGRSARRGTRVLVSALLALSVSTGCSVIDVIDNLGSDMPGAKKKTAVKAETTTPSQEGGGAKSKLQAYYNRKPKRSAPEDPDNPIIRCKSSSGTQYLRKHDCDLRGGHAAQ